MRKTIAITIAAGVVLLGAGAAQARPISPRVCTPAPCPTYKYTKAPWHPAYTTTRTPWTPGTRR